MKEVLKSNTLWTLILLGLILLFTVLTQNDYSWNWKITSLVVSSIVFVFFGLGVVGFSIFNLFTYLFKKIIKKQWKRNQG